MGDLPFQLLWCHKLPANVFDSQQIWELLQGQKNFNHPCGIRRKFTY